MPKSIQGGTAKTLNNLFFAPDQAPYLLDRLAGICLRAEADDSRLGDLSEQYVRSHEGARSHLGLTPWAMAASHLAASFHYVFATANVMLFTRAVEPGLHAVENGVAAFIAFDLRERTMSMLRFAAQRLVVPAVLLVCSALLINSAADAWRNWQQNEALMASLQRERAAALAQRIESFTREVESQVGWVAYPQFAMLPVGQRRFDYVRLLRQVPAITVLTQLDGQGHEQLLSSRLAMDVVGSDVDRSTEPAFVATKANRVYWGPVYFRRMNEPYITLAMAHGGRTGVTLAEVNLKWVWDAIKAVKVGDTGYGYIVDGKGRLIAYQDEKLVSRLPDLSALPQVAAARANPPAAEPFEGKTFDAAGAAAASVSSVNTVIPALGWRVFVDLPTAETQSALWGAVIRAAVLLVLGLLTGLLAIRIAMRPFAAAQPTPA